MAARVKCEEAKCVKAAAVILQGKKLCGSHAAALYQKMKQEQHGRAKGASPNRREKKP